MKYSILMAALLFTLNSCGQNSQGHGHHNSDHHDELAASDFKSEKISKSATITLNGNIEQVFPLFNPVEEPKWAPVFKPYFIYPADQTIQEGMSFKTAGHGDEKTYLWIITKYDTTQHLIQYLVSTQHRYWTITINCQNAGQKQTHTTARVTYSYYALNETGTERNRQKLDMIYAKDLQEWESAINEYLSKG